MNLKTVLKTINEYTAPALRSGVLSASDRISIRNDEGAWITREKAKLGSLTEKDIISLHADTKNTADALADMCVCLYAAHARLGAIVNSRSPYTLVLSRTGETVRPYVDDIAQIVGINIKCIDVRDTSRAVSLIKRRNAVLIKDMGALCVDSSLDDALAVTMITEKACAIHVQGEYIGGAKPINVIESALMRFVYIKKYSKQAALKK